MARIVVEIKRGTSESVIEELLWWCEQHCDNDSFHYFKANENLDEPARFWFEDEVDAFVFRFKYGL